MTRRLGRPTTTPSSAVSEAGRGKRHVERHARLAEPGDGVAADAQEGAVAQRDQPGVAGDDVQPERRDHVDADDAGDRQHIVAAQSGSARNRRARTRRASRRCVASRPQPLFGGIGFVEDADAHGSEPLDRGGAEEAVRPARSGSRARRDRARRRATCRRDSRPPALSIQPIIRLATMAPSTLSRPPRMITANTPSAAGGKQRRQARGRSTISTPATVPTTPASTQASRCA